MTHDLRNELKNTRIEGGFKYFSGFSLCILAVSSPLQVEEENFRKACVIQHFSVEISEGVRFTTEK